MSFGLLTHHDAFLLQGKMSRVLAAKCALSIRVDAMGDSPEPTIGLESRQMVRSCCGSFLLRLASHCQAPKGMLQARLLEDHTQGLANAKISLYRGSLAATSYPCPLQSRLVLTITVRGFEGGPDRLARLHML